MPMRYLFLSPPATGEMQPTLAVIDALLHLDPTSLIYIASGSSFKARYDALPFHQHHRSRVVRLDLGSTDDVEDYSINMLRRNKHRKPELFQSHRHRRGNPIPFFNYWQALLLVRKIIEFKLLIVYLGLLTRSNLI